MAVKAKFGEFKLSAVLLGNKKSPWSDDPMERKYNIPDNWNNHKITVTGPNGKRCTFDFWAGIANPEIRKASEVISAFQCFVTDASYAQDSFEEFCSNLGYDTDSRRAERTYKACQKSAEKLERIGAGDLYDLANSLNNWEEQSL